MSMNSSILPCILTVKDILLLPDTIVECFTSVTTKDLENYLESFIKRAESSGDQYDKEAAAKIRKAYVQYYELVNKINSDEMNDTIQLVANTNLIDISYNTEQAVLDSMLERFNAVLDGEKKIIRLDEDNFKATTSKMMELAYNTGDEEIIKTMAKVVKSMSNMSSIFINKSDSAVRSSRLTSALKFKEKIITLSNAIRDVTALKQQGVGDVSPRTWRCF